jgi:hypothetical protein
MAYKEQLNTLKRKSLKLRSHSMSFISTVDALEDLENYRHRLQEIYQSLISLDGPIHDLLHNEEYAAGSEHFEENVNRSKRAILKADSTIQDKRGDVTPPITSTVGAAYVKPKVIQEINCLPSNYNHSQDILKCRLDFVAI